MKRARPTASTRVKSKANLLGCVVEIEFDLKDAWYLPGNNPASAASGCSRTATSLEKRTFVGLSEKPRSAFLGSVRRDHVGCERPPSLRSSAGVGNDSLPR
ncbi:MAG TPA: hypothetical protein VKP30_11795, partial [Polyangiaceae bacterium]|nr:hypothetical protein [Polyangiaceae bacterium]